MGLKIKKEKSVGSGEYSAKLVKLEEATGLYGPCLKLFFEITEGEFAGHESSMIRPAKLIPGNKLDKTLQSMGVDTSAVVDELDASSLVGQNFKVKIETKTSEKGKVFANVVEVRALTAAEKTSALTAASAPKNAPASLPPQRLSQTTASLPPASEVTLDEVPF